MALIDDLGAGPVGVDTAPFIYFIEEDERFLRVIAPLFEAAESGKLELIVSSLTLLEVLVVPYRAGNVQLAQRYEAMLTHSRGVRMVDRHLGGEAGNGVICVRLSDAFQRDTRPKDGEVSLGVEGLLEAVVLGPASGEP